MTVAEVLRKAAIVMETRGLARYAFELHDGRVCLVGAVNLVTGGSPQWKSEDSPESSTSGEALRAVELLIEECAAVVWNDTTCRDAAESAELMRAAADLDDYENGRVPE